MTDWAMQWLDLVAGFVAANQRYFAVAQASSSVMSVFGWTIGFLLLISAWRRGQIVGFAGFNFERRDALRDTAAAMRNWQAKAGEGPVDMVRLRSTIDRAFDPDIVDHLIGRSVMWVDDNPANNDLAIRALRKLMLDVVQVTSTEDALAMLRSRHFDIIISDMGRGTNATAGYELLAAVRETGSKTPFFIFSSEDKPEFRKEAKKRGAQLSTNDMLELIDCIVSKLGRLA